MIAFVKQYGRKTLTVTLEAIAVLFLILVLVLGLAVWRLTTGPVDVSFAKKYIETALHDADTRIEITFGKVMLHWPDIHDALLLTLQDIGLKENGKTIADVDSLGIALSRPHLLIGQIKPTQIVLDRPSLHLVRTAENDIALFLDNQSVAADPAAPDNAIGREDLPQLLDDLLSPDAENSHVPSLMRQLNALEIKNAQMIVEDHVIGMTWYLPNIDLAFARDPNGLMANASLDLPGGGGLDGASSIQADINYDKGRKIFETRFYVQDFNPHFLSEKIEFLAFLNKQSVSLNGDIRLQLSPTLDLQNVDALISADAGVLQLDGIYNEPFRFENIYLDASYDHTQKFVDIRKLSLKANDTEIIAQSPIRYSDDKIAAALTVSIPEIQLDKLPPIWPYDALKGEPAEDWLLHKLSDGRIRDTKVSLDIMAQKTPVATVAQEPEWEIKTGNIKAEFTAADMSVDYRAPLRKITHANGKGILENDTMTINVDNGKLGDLDIGPSKVVIDHVIEEGIGNANIAINLKGPVTSVFDYIKDEPINKKPEDIGLDGGKVKGNADLNVNIKFPTKKDLPVEDVKVSAKGILNNVSLPGVVRGLDLTGGPLALDLGEGKVALSGDALLDGRPVNLQWEEFLESEGKPYASRIQAELIADKKLRDHFGVNLDDWVTGNIPVDLTYTEYANDSAMINITGDITPSVLMVKAFDYMKPAGQVGSFSATAYTQGPYMKELKGLTVKTPELDLQNGVLNFAARQGESILTGGSIGHVTLGESKLNIDFEIGASDLLKLDIKGEFLDARSFLADKGQKTEKNTQDPVIASVAVDRMRTADSRLIERVKLYLDMDRQGDMNQLEMDAVAGKGDIYLRLKPDTRGLMTLRLEADDAGATLRAFDVYENVKGGTLVIEGKANTPQSKSVLYGKVQLSDFRVINAPVLARLLGALGPTSIAQLLSGEGIYFSKLESDFDWRIRKTGDLYVANNGRTSGSSLGLTFEGTIDKAQDKMDLKGTVVPVSMINSMVSDIPIIGTVLGGGKDGALIAATYKIEGSAKDPKVTVNPLAALAPGFLRKLLFEE